MGINPSPGQESLYLENCSHHCQAELHKVCHHREDLSYFNITPVVFEGNVLVCDDFASLVQSLDEAIVLRDAKDDCMVDVALRLAIVKRRLQSEGWFDWDSNPGFRVGPSFRDSYQGLHPSIGVLRKILFAASCSVLNQEQSATHELDAKDRKNEHEGQPMQAWRRDITRKHHLHYWKGKDGFIEFARVAYPHDDFEI